VELSSELSYGRDSFARPWRNAQERPVFSPCNLPIECCQFPPRAIAPDGKTRVSERKTQKYRKSQSRDTNDCLRHGPRLQRLRDGHIEKFLDEPEAGVVHVREHEGTGSRREH